MNSLYDLIIIGAGPAGASAAIYAGRARLKTLLIDAGESGGQIRITSEIVNYPGIVTISGAEYSDNLHQQVLSFGAEILSAKVTDLDLSAPIKKITTSAGNYESVAVIVASGATPRPAGFEGEDTYRGRGVSYCATCDGEFFSGMEIIVIGGGYAAAEEAEFLTRYARKVHMLVRRDQLSCATSIAEHILSHPKIEVHFNTVLSRLEGDDLPRKAVLYNNKTQQYSDFLPQAPDTSLGVFVFTGYEPQSALFQGKLELDENGYIPTNDSMQTNLPGIYAAGDIRPKTLRQLVTAVADGAIAATDSEKYISSTKQSLNITIEREEKQTQDNHTHAHSFIDDDLAKQLTPILDRFEQEVSIVTILDGDDEYSQQLHDFVASFPPLSNKIKSIVVQKGERPDLEELFHASRYPFIAFLDHNNKDCGVRYETLPSAHEFNSFVLALYNAAGPGQNVDEVTLGKIAEITEPMKVEIGISLTCTMCPDVIQGFQLIARHNPNVSVEVVDVFRYPDFKSKYQIMSVPATVINDAPPIFGKKPLNELISMLQPSQN